MRLALVGKSGSGKSEAADVLRQAAGCEVVKTGSICRQIALLLFGNEDKRSTQLLDDALTKLDPSIFLRAALRQVDPTMPFVIDALRFHSDYQLARSMGCKVIRIVSADTTREQRLKSRGQVFDLIRDGAHRSETELDSAPVDAVIENDGDRAALHAKVRSLAKAFHET